MSDSEQTRQSPRTSIVEEMRSSFIDYAMSVIISRALPNVRDGLKPVHRRVLYAMHQLRNSHNQPYKKSARIVGDVIGKYHPHGDQSVYDALVRMAQAFSLRYPLADGQGNFGSIDGDPAAAMRYTEVRMARIGGEMLSDIEQETVDWSPNYDEKEVEPDILPARVPNLLVNGAQGIAVGMATNIPPHNLREVINGILAMISDPSISLPELMQHIPGPDFPTFGTIHGRTGIIRAYETGRGSITIRAKTEFEEIRAKKQAIIVSELPYQVNKARLMEKIAQLVKEKRIEGITDLRDESDRQGIRMVIELRRDMVPEVVLNQLYKQTQLQDSFGINTVAIVDGRPEVLRLRDILHHFIEHRRDIVTRRSIFQLREAKKREHILEGLKIALDHLNEVIELIRRSASPPAAKQGLMERFALSEVQAQAILDMRLQRLTGLERDKILQELAEIRERITFLQSLLSNESELMKVVTEELEEIRDRYGDDRRTEIVDASGDIAIEDLIADEEMVVTVSHSGYIKRAPSDEYRAQKRGGKGVSGMATRDEDFVRELFIAHTHNYIMMFTNTGRVYVKRVYEIPRASRAARGKAIVNLLELREGERVDQMVGLPEFREELFVLFSTRDGVIKRTRLMDFANIRSNGIIAIDIEEGDELIDVRLTDGKQDILLTSRKGMAIRFCEEQVRAMGRSARGVRGIKLGEKDAVVGMAVMESDSSSSVVTVCEHGYGKRTAASEFHAQNRGGKGLIAIKTSERNGQVAGSRMVDESDEVMILANSGRVIRMPVADISQIGRNTQGVRLIRLDDSEVVVGMERLAETDEDESTNDESVTTENAPSDSQASDEVEKAGAEVDIPDASGDKTEDGES
ncbi:MAG: DNA gyrase subunit A [Deltaproteobacteria bacterium]|nr:DNA gyrase subunit A [Deltaproteobacteria bacterium]